MTVTHAYLRQKVFSAMIMRKKQEAAKKKKCKKMKGLSEK
jgi:hypothetical protein